MRKECYAYTRVSTAKQGEGVSLQAQKEAIQAFADRNDLLITDWFEEKETAAKSGRPVFSGMLTRLRKGEASGVIIHKIDRSARNFADWAKIGELSDSGIDVHFAAESIDFRSRGGRLTADIQAVIAADYIRNLRDETIKGINGRLKQGLYPFKAPIGYLDNGGGKPKTIDPVRGPKVAELFRLYATGEHTLRSLITEAEKMNLRGLDGAKVGKSVIERMIANPFYIGLMHIKRRGETYQGCHEPLISVELFDRVTSVRSGKSFKKSAKNDFVYRRILTCQTCGNSMIGERQKGHVYYRCHTPSCRGVCVREEAIEGAVKTALSGLELPVEAIACLEELAARWRRELPAIQTDQAIPMQLEKIEERKRKLVDALLDDLIDKGSFEERNRQLLLQATELRERLTNTANETKTADHIERFLELFESLYSTYVSGSNCEKRQMIEILFSNLWVKGKSVELKPRKWVGQCASARLVPVGGPPRDCSRSGSELGSNATDEFMELFNSKEVQELLEIRHRVSEAA